MAYFHFINFATRLTDLGLSYYRINYDLDYCMENYAKFRLVAVRSDCIIDSNYCKDMRQKCAICTTVT